MKNFFSLYFSIILLIGCSTNDDDNSKKSSGIPSPQSTSTPNNTSDSNTISNNGDRNGNLNDITSAFETLMSAYDFVGAQVAITRNEKLVYLKSFGKSDYANGIAVNDRSLFRIAGISKPITLMAISKLVSENKLDVDDFVFGTNGLLGTQYGTPPYEPLEESIRVSHLLDHKGGFMDEPNDIMFEDVTMSHSDLIGKVLDERSLAYEPGTKYEYSNFGYCLLGRIIEKVSGMTYEEYVKQEILAPMNIDDMKISGNRKGDAYPGEVGYYSTWASPYSLNVTRMDANGGWIASAKSLATLAMHSDGQRAFLDLLTPEESLSYLKNGAWNHNGALPGTTGVLQVGYPTSYVVLINTGNEDFYEVLQVVRSFMNVQINQRTEWPSSDLFDYL